MVLLEKDGGSWGSRLIGARASTETTMGKYDAGCGPSGM